MFRFEVLMRKNIEQNALKQHFGDGYQVKKRRWRFEILLWMEMIGRDSEQRQVKTGSNENRRYLNCDRIVNFQAISNTVKLNNLKHRAVLI